MRQRDQLSKKKKVIKEAKAGELLLSSGELLMISLKFSNVSLGPKPNLMSLHSALFFSLTLFAILEFRDFSR